MNNYYAQSYKLSKKKIELWSEFRDKYNCLKRLNPPYTNPSVQPTWGGWLSDRLKNKPY